MNKALIQALVAAACLTIWHESPAQLLLDHDLTPEEMVLGYLVGPGVTVSNVILTQGADTSAGQHQAAAFNAQGIPALVEHGIVLSTGNVDYVANPATEFSSDPYYGYDPDLGYLVGNTTLDAVSLELDLVADGDTVQLDIMLASEEHPEYICTQFNDAMGVFLSGPGVIGPFMNNAVNMGLLPGTDSAMTVNTIRVPDTAIVVPGQCEPANSPLYVDNTADTSIVFDGMTTWLTMRHAVQAGETYHMKIAVADTYDTAWDSGLFLAGGSLRSTATNTSVREIQDVRAWWDGSGNLRATVSGDRSGQVELFDATGRSLMRRPISGSLTWTGTGLASGAYLLQLVVDGERSTLNVIKP